MTEFFGYLHNFAIYSPIIPLFPLLFFWKKIGKNPLAQAVLILLCLDFFTDLITMTCVVWNHWYHTVRDFQQVYSFLFSFTTYNVFRLGISNPKALKIITVAFVAAALFQLYFIITDFGLQHTIIHPVSPLSALIIFVTIYYYYETFTEMKIKNLSNHPFFWVYSALLLYVGGAFILRLFQTGMDTIVPGISSRLWPINSISTIIFNFLILRAVWLMKKA